MFKPFEFYIKEKKKVNSTIKLEDIKNDWNKEDNKKILIYIKQAENAYDKFANVII
jgi:hypothetical protein